LARKLFVLVSLLLLAMVLFGGCGGGVVPGSSGVSLRLEVLEKNTYSADVRMVYANYSSETFYLTRVGVEVCFAGNQCYSLSVPATYAAPLYPGEVRSTVETFYLVDPVYGRLESLSLVVDGYFSSGRSVTVSSGKLYF